MCGIFGTITTSNFDSTELLASVAPLMRLMYRRGPDDEGLWHNKHCVLGFRRLAILDLAPTGHQPMISEGGRYILVFNGEVYNFHTLRIDLERKGISFRSTGDTEVILYALATWGTSALKRFNGMFALAFYDTIKNTLLLARDHAGIKPLYYLHTTQGLVFASQYNQVIQHPWAKTLGISESGLSLYLRFGYVPAPYTLQHCTHLLDAGSWLEVDTNGQTHGEKYYQFPQYSEPTLHGEDAVDALDEAISRSITRHLISDVPVGLFLSGGIDSPLVAAEAVRQTSSKLKAFSIGVTDQRLDESVAAKAYAQILEIEHILKLIDEQQALALLDSVVEACNEPTADFSIFPTLLISQIASEQVKVVLSGDGGDELFWGYPERFGEVLDQATYYNYPIWMRYVWIAARRYLGWGRATRETLYQDIGAWFQKKHTVFSETDLNMLFPELKPVPEDLPLFSYTDTDIHKTAQWLRWNEFQLHLARILLKVDRASMHCSLEVRVPLLDKDIIAVATQTDWMSCLDLSGRSGKLPLRKVLKRKLAYQTQVKKGFTVPMHQWLTGTLQPLLKELVLERDYILGMPINRTELLRINSALQRGDQSKAGGLWLLLSLALWQEHHYRRIN